MIPPAKPLLGKEEEETVIEVLRSGMLAAGSWVREFEDAFGKYNHSRNAVATSSGTTALHVMLEALNIGAGDKVFVTAFSFIASANAILYTGATPIFVDIDPLSCNLSPSELEKAILKNPGARAVLVVHLFGLPADMAEIMRLARKHNLIVLEDCAQAIGAEYRGQKVGTFGEAAAFSFYPTKNITTGEGGIVLTDNPAVAEKIRVLVNQGQRRRYYHETVGYNYRMTNIHAAIGVQQLKKLELFNRARREHARFYDRTITNPFIRKPEALSDRTHVYHQYTLRVSNRENFARHLTASGIGYGIHYPLTIPAQTPYRTLAAGSGTWPAAEKLAESCLSIPVHPSLSHNELLTVVEAINQFR